ncbi:MAG: bacillithiol biosynthesis BshC [Phycisphaera sp.]|nr:bacillithiol biosynthesis BshC [Phycisphaera sp.]
MREMTTLPMTTEPVDYARDLGVPGFGPGGVMARLAAGELTGRVPLLSFESPAAASASRHLDRAALADVLASINAEAGNTLDERVVESIRHDAVFVIAGQQPGLLLGPMYTLLKAVSAIGVARRLRDTLGVPVIPAFWIAGEDHDIEEVNRCWLGGQKLVLPHAELNHAGPRPPVATLSLEPFRDDITRFVAETLGGLPHGASVTDLVASVRFDSYASMCADLMARLLGPHGLVLVDPMRLRQLAAPVMADMADRWGELRDAFERGGAAMRDLDLAAPIDRLNLFRLGPDGRDSVDDPSGLGDAIRADPKRYSPGAALRPIVQDAVLPTVATIAGPTELQYLWQIDAMYGVVGVTRSATWPRVSATFVDPATAQIASRFGLRGGDLLTCRANADSLERAADSDANADVEEVRSLGDELLRRIDALMQRHDSKPVRKARESIEYQVGRVVERVTQDRAAQAGLGRSNLRRVIDAVLPDGAPQDRRLCPLEMLAEHGTAWITWLIDHLDPAAVKHCLVIEGATNGG